jgi:ankyrin repeat protein
MIDPNMPLSERMARRHVVKSRSVNIVFHELIRFLSSRICRRILSHLRPSLKKLICKSHANHRKLQISTLDMTFRPDLICCRRPKSSQLSHSSASTTSNPLFQSDILSNCFINELDERGVTPLIHAIEFGDTEVSSLQPYFLTRAVRLLM